MANKNKDIVIVSAVRTPFGRLYGSLRDVNSYDLGAIPIREILKRVNVPGKTVGEVFWGVSDASICSELFTVASARQALIKAGLPHDIPSVSLDKSGVSAFQAVRLAAMTIKSGSIDCAIAGGAASLSGLTQVYEKLRYNTPQLGDAKKQLPSPALEYEDYIRTARDCDLLAVEYGVDRVEQDEWAYRSHMNYLNAWNSGKLKEEIFPLSFSIQNKEPVSLGIDEQYRPDITLEVLSRLKSIRGTEGITAGNSAGMGDGASAVLLMTREKAIESGVQPLATVVANVSMAIDASRTAETPGYAIQMACKKAGLNLDDIDVIEINEDFACIPLVSLRIVAGDDNHRLQGLKDKTNINGSSIAVGHPSTATAARIIMNLMYELRRRGGGYALGTLCSGLAQADACIIKVD